MQDMSEGNKGMESPGISHLMWVCVTLVKPCSCVMSTEWPFIEAQCVHGNVWEKRVRYRPMHETTEDALL